MGGVIDNIKANTDFVDLAGKFLTLGLFTFVINAGLIMLMGEIVPGFGVKNFGTALLAAVVLALLNVVLGRLR